MRLAEASRWWCTAEVSSRDGIGAHWAVAPRSDSTTYSTPRLTAAETCSQIAFSWARSSSTPPATRYTPFTLRVRRVPSASRRCWMRASWSLSITGNGTSTWRVRTCSRESTLPCGPIAVRIEVTCSSRIASSGGFVTWAKDCTK